MGSISFKNFLISTSYFFIIILLFFLALNKSITGDETSTAFLAANLSFHDLFIQNYDGEFNPPLFFIFNKILIDFFGFHSFLLKSIPLFFFFLSAFIFRESLKHFFENDFHINVATIIYLITPLNFYYSLFDKPYSFLLLTTNLLIYLSLLIKKNHQKKYYIFYIVTSVVGIYTHFFTGLIMFLIFISGAPFFWKHHKNFVLKIFLLNLLTFFALIPEMFILKDMITTVASIEQPQSEGGYLMKILFLIYGLFFGNTMMPINVLTTSLVFLSCIVFFFTFAYNIKKFFRDPLILFSTVFMTLTILLVGLTDIARPMYIIFLTPILIFLISVISFKHKNHILLPCVLILFIFSDINFITSNSKYYISPLDTINYKKFYNFDEVSFKINTDDIIIISPSYNKSSFALYNDSKNKIIYINPYDEIEEQLKNINLDNKNIHLFYEHHNSNLEQSLDIYLSNYDKVTQINKSHLGFSSKSKYSFFKINSYLIKND